MPFTFDQIVAATGAPIANVTACWPPLLSALTAAGMPTLPTQIAAIATIAVECPTFYPQTEKYNGTPETYFSRYDDRADLGNTHPGDGLRFRGRGFIQLTGRANYQKFGNLLHTDLITNPDRALDVRVAADVFALFFREHHIDIEAKSGNWVKVRKLVNGGTNGLNDFLDVVNYLEKLKAV